MEHKITIMKYQLVFPGMTKKLFDEKERFYQITAISIRLDELQTKGAVLQKMGKPTKNGTRMTFARCRVLESMRQRCSGFWKMGKSWV